jgi:magnesium-transporting ATPase (P-type)
MRTPLQILFLILVTDLPPSIALGMERGDKSIIKAQPRPKEEPIVLGWMWASIIMNGTILSTVILGVYIFSLVEFCEGEILQTEILNIDDYRTKLAKARTVAFISLVYSENIRAYIARSFDKPFWVNLCGNTQMQKAIVVAQICLYIAVFVPVLSDQILKLNGLDIGLWGWAVAAAGPIATVVLCELAKIITHAQVQRYQAKLVKQRSNEESSMKSPYKEPNATLVTCQDAQAVSI